MSDTTPMRWAGSWYPNYCTANCNGDQLSEALQSNAHFFYDRRVVDIDDELPKRG